MKTLPNHVVTIVSLICGYVNGIAHVSYTILRCIFNHQCSFLGQQVVVVVVVDCAGLFLVVVVVVFFAVTSPYFGKVLDKTTRTEFAGPIDTRASMTNPTVRTAPGTAVTVHIFGKL